MIAGASPAGTARRHNSRRGRGDPRRGFPATERRTSDRRRSSRSGLSSHCLRGKSKAPSQFLTSHPAVVEDLAQQAGSDRFLSVNRDDRDPTIRMPKEMMTPADSNDLESEPTQSADEILPG